MTLPYDPATPLPRELTRHYISASDEDIANMMETLGLKDLEQLFQHIDAKTRFATPPATGPEFEYHRLTSHMEQMAAKNRPRPSFIGDGLKSYRTPQICAQVAQIRGLSTAYTPYQPERSQGTLSTLWIYSNALSQLTGFEAINASLYDRATCLFETIMTAKRTQGKGSRAVICGPLYPGDQTVLTTLTRETTLTLHFLPHHPETGRCPLQQLQEILEEDPDIFSVVYSQVNALGLLEDVDALTDLAQKAKLQTIALIDPVHLPSRGLKSPREFGSQGGPDFIVGEGQHLCLPPLFGGPGLGIFGMRHPGRKRGAIRNAPGRLIGEAKDLAGRTCKSIVLSTREQHIRRERATSNICSNQSFVATLAGAALLEQGDQGLNQCWTLSRKRAHQLATRLTRCPGVTLSYPSTPFGNEFVLNLGRDCDQLIELGRRAGLHIGINVSERVGDGSNHHLMIFCNDLQEESDLNYLAQFFTQQQWGEATGGTSCPPLPSIPQELMRATPVALPQYPQEQLLSYYQKLGEQNVSPDNAIYPLGSCTMKYNPYLNDYTASLPGFSDIHPQAPVADCQGSLQVLFEIQETFKAITGLAAVTTQPVAGAQGELVGLKMFQAYHRERGEQRDILLIPKSAHGTNPATATMAGFESIVLIDAHDDGLINFEQLQTLVQRYGERLCGIMMTNPNTSGVFEQRFWEISQLVHNAGGLVYMDGANMNAIAGWVDLGQLGVDAVHNNLHKTWTVPHGGGGPGDAIVAVSERLAPYLPGYQVEQQQPEGTYLLTTPAKSIGSFHRHFGNFGHKVRALTYLKRLGTEGIRRMSGVATLSSRYLYHHLKQHFSTLPINPARPVMHEFILTLSREEFATIEAIGIPKAQIIPRLGKLFLDYGLHAPTVAFPEQFGLMVEPTESFSQNELDRFVQVARSIKQLVVKHPEVLHTVPHFTPIDRVDEVAANRHLQLTGDLSELPVILPNRVPTKELATMDVDRVAQKIVDAHKEAVKTGSALQPPPTRNVEASTQRGSCL